MQQLKERNTYTPTNTSLVRSNCGSSLNNSEDRNSVVGLKTSFNNPEENQSQHIGSSDLRVQNRVYVLSMRGQPLMPTTEGKASHLLKEEKAKVVRRKPFTIQLKYATGETKQETTLGMETGYKNVGVSVISGNKELYSAEVKLRTNVSKKLTEKRMYRRSKRNRLWYRKDRFLNRNIKKGWLAYRARIGLWMLIFKNTT